MADLRGKGHFAEYEAEEHNEPVVSAMDNSNESNVPAHGEKRQRVPRSRHGFGRHSNTHGHKGAKSVKLRFKDRMDGATKYLDHEANTHHLAGK